MDTTELVLVTRARRMLKDGSAMRIRLDLGIARAELAAAAGVSVAALSRWEHGASMPRGAPALKFARALSQLTMLAGAVSDDFDVA